MGIDKISTQELKNNFGKYASECTTDDLLDALNLSKEDEERKSTIIEILKRQASEKVLWKFSSNWKFVFNDGVEKKDGNWKYYIEVDGKRYYDYWNGMNWLCYCRSHNKIWVYYLLYWEIKDGYVMQWTVFFNNWEKYVWHFKNNLLEWQWTYTWPNWNKYVGHFKNGLKEWHWTFTRANWNKYEWEWKNDVKEWQWTYTWANWDKYEWERKNDLPEWQWTYTWTNWKKYEWEWKNDKRNGRWTFTWANWNTITWTWNNDDISEGKIKLKSDGTEIDVIWDDDKGFGIVITEWKYKGKFVDGDTWEFIENTSSPS